jgi:hypothetical protein
LLDTGILPSQDASVSLDSEEDLDFAPPVARIAFAVASVIGGLATGPLDTFYAASQSLVPGTMVQRYRRNWRLARYIVVDDRIILGRIGFEEPGTVEEIWNEEIQDFEEKRLTLGTTSPFVMDTASLRIAYQLRPGRIRPTTFTGNLQALLNAAAGRTWRWRVRPDVLGIPWDDWIESVDKVTELRLKIREPNPNWGGRRRVEEVVTGANAALVNIVYRARKDSSEGVDLTDEMIAESIEHADDGYGEYSAVGERVENGERVSTRWRPEVEGEPLGREVEADPTTSEASHDELRQVLEETTEDE